MKRLKFIMITLMIGTFVTTSLSQSKNDLFLLNNHFDKVTKVNDSTYNIQMSKHLINFDFINNKDFVINSYYNPTITTSYIKTLDLGFNESGYANTPNNVIIINKRDSTYVYKIVNESVAKYIETYSEDLNEFIFYKINETIYSLNYTKNKLNKSANFQLASLLTSIIGGVTTGVIMYKTTNTNLGYAMISTTTTLSLGFTITSIIHKKKSSANKVNKIKLQ